MSPEAGWGYDWGTPWSGSGQIQSMADTGTGSNAVNETMGSAIAAQTTRVEGYEWVVIPSIVLLVSHLRPGRGVKL